VRQPDLILNGWELHHGTCGITVYLRLLIQALECPPQSLDWRLALPRPLAHLGGFVPPERLLLVDGKDVQGYLARNLYWNYRLARHVRRNYPDSVFHSIYHFWAPLPPRKLLLTIHDCIEETEPSVRLRNFQHRLHRWLCHRTARRARRVIAISNWTKSQVVAHYGIKPGKIDVLYNWVRPACQKPVSPAEIAAVRERYKLPERYIAYVGGYRAYKNVEFLINAWHLAKTRQPIPSLVLAGQIPRETENGYYCDIQGALNRLGGDALDVVRPGLIADDDLPAFYAGAALFVSPSRLEGFGYPAVEAMASGVPTLVSDASVYPELIEEGHLRFPLENPELLAERILAALTDPHRFLRALDPRFTEAEGKIRYEQIVRSLAEVSGKQAPA